MGSDDAMGMDPDIGLEEGPETVEDGKSLRYKGCLFSLRLHPWKYITCQLGRGICSLCEM